MAHGAAVPDTTRLQLPLIAAAQAQKHVTHNEAIMRLDGLVQMTALSYTTNVQPGSPSDGDLYLLPAGKTGTDWDGYSNHAVAHRYDGIWHQYHPSQGWLCFVRDTASLYYYTGSQWAQCAPLSLPTRQVFTSGSGTYTTPTACRQLRVRMKGGGAGGAGSGSTGPNDGGAGGDTSFNSVVAKGGNAGSSATGAPGLGGTGGSGMASLRIPGAAGLRAIIQITSATNAQQLGEQGGGDGGGIGGGGPSAGVAGAANSGSGGGGGGSGDAPSIATIVTRYQGAGGGSGEYVELIIDGPGASYSYVVGASGTAGSAGTNGTAGGAGGTGYISVDEYY